MILIFVHLLYFVIWCFLWSTWKLLSFFFKSLFLKIGQPQIICPKCIAGMQVAFSSHSIMGQIFRKCLHFQPYGDVNATGTIIRFHNSYTWFVYYVYNIESCLYNKYTFVFTHYYNFTSMACDSISLSFSLSLFSVFYFSPRRRLATVVKFFWWTYYGKTRWKI